MKEQNSKIIIFKTDDEKITVDTRFDEDTAWLSLNQMATLFERDKSTISRHIKNVYEEGELEQSATVAKFATVQTEGERQVERQLSEDIFESFALRSNSFKQLTNEIGLPNIDETWYCYYELSDNRFVECYYHGDNIERFSIVDSEDRLYTIWEKGVFNTIKTQEDRPCVPQEEMKDYEVDYNSYTIINIWNIPIWSWNRPHAKG